jgi:hypothetical protein
MAGLCHGAHILYIAIRPALVLGIQKYGRNSAGRQKSKASPGGIEGQTISCRQYANLPNTG